MRQVPQGQKSYTLIGSGRMAKHIGHYLTIKGFEIFKWSRSDDPEFNSLPIIPNQPPEDRLNILADKTSHILLAISDDAIQKYADLYSHDHSVIHFSGSFFCENSIGLHPLMTFGTDLYCDEFYEQIPFVIDQPVTLSDLLPGLNNSFYTIPADKKDLYHGLCSMGGNFTQIILQQVLSNFASDLNLPIEILKPFISKSIENCFSDPNGCLTGPLVRNDAATIERHKNVFKGTPEIDLYNSLEKYFKSTLKNGESQ